MILRCGFEYLISFDFKLNVARLMSEHIMIIEIAVGCFKFRLSLFNEKALKGYNFCACKRKVT